MASSKFANELIVPSKYSSSKHSTDSHGWLDNYGKNKWDYFNTYVTYVVDGDDEIWLVELQVPNSADENKILYDTKVKENVAKAVKSTNAPHDEKISHENPSVNTTAQNEIEMSYITQYKDKINFINSEQKKLDDIRAKIKERSFAKRQMRCCSD